MDASKIEKIMGKTWKKFVKYYDCKAFEYSKSLANIDEAKDSHWICWNESDLMVQFGRFFYDQLNDPNSNIEMHFDKKLNRSNFKGYVFENKLEELKKNLRREPKLDLIITPEDSVGPFLICAEAKYFHYSAESMSHHKLTVEGVIKKDIETLLEIKKLNIAERIVFIIFDDYYYLNEPNKHNKINNMLKNCGEIKILSHNSSAKVKYWR